MSRFRVLIRSTFLFPKEFKKTSSPYWRSIESRYSAQPAEKSARAVSAASLFESLVPKLSVGGRHVMTFSLCKQTKCLVIRPAITRCRYKCCSSRTTRQTTRCDALKAREWLKIINLEATGTTVVLKKTDKLFCLTQRRYWGVKLRVKSGVR